MRVFLVENSSTMFTFLKLLRNPVADKIEKICLDLNLDSDLEVEIFLSKNSNLKEILNNVPTYKKCYDYYYNFYKQSNFILENLESAEEFLDIENLKEIFLSYKENDDKRNFNIIDSFLTKIEIPHYDRLTSVTGRQKIVNGPQILTLKKEDRKKIFKNKNLYLLDFSALEPSVLFQILGYSNLDYSDLYSSIKEKLDLKFISRADVKLSVLKILYGSSLEHIKEINKEESVKLESFLLNENFQKFKKTLSNDLYHNGQLYNFFGKPIISKECIKDTNFQDYMLIDYYIQSTAADLSLILLSKFLEKNIYHINPLFVIHDALLFYAKPSFELKNSLHLEHDIFKIYAKIEHSNA